MTAIPGVQVGGTVVPFDTNDTFSTHNEIYGKGGYRSVATIVDRNAISSDRRKEGMLVNVISDQIVYQLLGGITNSNWVIFSSGAAISGTIFGNVQCDTNNYTYTITGAGILPQSYITATLKIPTYNSVTYQCCVTEIVSGSFRLVLAEIPDISGYSINWSVNN